MSKWAHIKAGYIDGKWLKTPLHTNISENNPINAVSFSGVGRFRQQAAKTANKICLKSISFRRKCRKYIYRYSSTVWKRTSWKETFTISTECDYNRNEIINREIKNRDSKRGTKRKTTNSNVNIKCFSSQGVWLRSTSTFLFWISMTSLQLTTSFFHIDAIE